MSSIDREDTIKILKDLQKDHLQFCLIPFRQAIERVQALPSADRSQGEWVYGEHDVAMCDGYRCNRCDFFVPWDYEHKFIDFINDYHYCPSCGARMKGADDEQIYFRTQEMP